MVQREAVLRKPREPKKERVVLKHTGLGSHGIVPPLKTPLAAPYFSLSSLKQRDDDDDDGSDNDEEDGVFPP